MISDKGLLDKAKDESGGVSIVKKELNREMEDHKRFSLALFSRKGSSYHCYVQKKRCVSARNVLFLILFLTFTLSITFNSQFSIFNSVKAASDSDDKSTIEQLAENIEDSLDKIDFGELDNIASDLTDTDLNLFKSESFGKKVGKILSGEFADDYPNIFMALLGLFGSVVFDVLPIIVLVVGVALLSGFVQSLRSESAGGVNDVVHFASFAAVIVIILGVVMTLSTTTGAALASMKRQMDIIFPILLTLMAAVGGTVSVGVYQPAVVMLSSGVMQIFTYIVMPLFFITFIFSVVGHISDKTKLDKFTAFFSSLFKWTIGVTFTVFLAFLAIQGITAGTHDGVSIRAAKLTISSYVPFLGNYVSQGFDLVMASSVLIKNAIGVSGMYLLFGVVLTPVIKIAVVILGLKLAAAVTQPMSDGRISNFLTSVNKAFSMLVACLVGAAFMYFLTIGLVVCSANVF